METSLLNLLTLLIKPTSGDLLLGNISLLNNINANEFRSRLGYITQENVIFNDSIYNNLSLWSENKKLYNVKNLNKRY